MMRFERWAAIPKTAATASSFSGDCDQTPGQLAPTGFVNTATCSKPDASFWNTRLFSQHIAREKRAFLNKSTA
jgi:hypothetical protein